MNPVRQGAFGSAWRASFESAKISALVAVCGIAASGTSGNALAGADVADVQGQQVTSKPPIHAPFGGHRDAADPGTPSAASAGEPGSAAYTYVHHPVSTTNPAAQFAFDRGLTMVFAYQPTEAQEAFREAAKLDPSLAMAWWGIGLALGPNINITPDAHSTREAAEAMQRATTLAESGKLAEPERDYIAALKVRYVTSDNPDFDSLATHYRDSMRELLKKYPQDADARALFAEAIMDLHPWRLWNNDGSPQEGTPELVRTLEEGLAQQPNHIGLLHFYIHAVEASPDPGRALEVAHRLAALPMEPAAAHLVHMPAHIYMRVGDWESAVQANEHSIHYALDYRLSSNPTAQNACGHCADFLSYAYMMQANLANARRSAETYQKMTSDPSNATAVLVRFSRWAEILKLPEPADDKKNDAHNVHALLGQWHYARGLAYLAQHQQKQAAAELDALHAEHEKAPRPTAVDAGTLDLAHSFEKLGQHDDVSNLAVSEALLSSRVAEARRQMPIAVRLMRNAVALEDQGPYSEPPIWFYPTRESLGALLLRSGAPVEAETVFRDSLKRVPNDPRALLGLVKALQVQAKKAEAAAEQKHADEAARFADTQLTLAQM